DLNQINFGMVPARMHDALPGQPLLFVSTYGQRLQSNVNSSIPVDGTYSNTALIVTRMTNYFSPKPGYLQTIVTVPDFGSSSRFGTVSNGSSSGTFPDIIQPGNNGFGSHLSGNDTQIESVAWQ